MELDFIASTREVAHYAHYRAGGLVYTPQVAKNPAYDVWIGVKSLGTGLILDKHISPGQVFVSGHREG